jgi:hypothetical protein
MKQIIRNKPAITARLTLIPMPALAPADSPVDGTSDGTGLLAEALVELRLRSELCHWICTQALAPSHTIGGDIVSSVFPDIVSGIERLYVNTDVTPWKLLSSSQ